MQVIVDNFDANISSPNCLASTHALAMILTQSPDKPGSILVPLNEETSIPRIRKEGMRKPIDDTPVSVYYGLKKPPMPDAASRKAVLPLKVLAQQVILDQRTKELDFAFLKSIGSNPHTPEFGGFNTKMAREQGHAVKPKMLISYRPLINRIPSDPTTTKTAMDEAQRLTRQLGQECTIFTADLQLYRVGLFVQWVYPDIFDDQFVLRLGGMHFLMSFVGTIGALMADSGLEDVLKSAFGGVARMLPQNACALRMVTEELLRDKLEEVESYEELMVELESRATESRTAKLWLNCLIKPVLLCMELIRVEWESDWALHLLAVKQMLPYFFAAGHIHYARYGMIYLRSMEKLDSDVLNRFLKGQHVQHHRDGIWNGLWSDIMTGSTFM